MPARYFACPNSVRWRQWGDEMVAYNGRHRSTHLLSAAAAEVLKLLLQVDCTADELGQRLLADSDPLADAGSAPMPLLADEQESLEALLAELGRLGLVEVRPA